MPHRHVGEQGILLEEIPHPPLLGRQVDLGGAVEEGHAVQHDAPPVRGQDPRHTPERHALSAAGGTQQRQGLPLRFKLDLQMEVPHGLFDLYIQPHQRLPPFSDRCRVSSRFTASRKTAEMAMFTSTHQAAPTLSLVRQSW